MGQNHPELTIVDLPAGAGVLASPSRRPDTLLDEPGVIDDPHPGLVAELARDVSTQVLTRPVDVPARGAQQPLSPSVAMPRAARSCGLAQDKNVSPRRLLGDQIRVVAVLQA